MITQMYCNLIEFGTPEFDEALSLRELVLRKPLHMTFEIKDISKEYDEIHIGCYRASTAVLLGVMTFKHISKHQVKMRQVAVDPSVQSKGVGSFLVNFAEMWAKSRGIKNIELHARINAVPFYQKLGYTADGPVFKEVNIDHLFMYKNL